MPAKRTEALPTQLESIKYLSELALELRVSWDHSTDDIWRRLDAEL
jgi:glycogen phosphorylase